MKLTVNTTPAQLAQVSAFLLSKGINITEVRVHGNDPLQVVSLIVVAANVLQPEVAKAEPKRLAKGNPPLSREKVAQIRDLRNSGHTIAETAAIAGVATSTVSRRQGGNRFSRKYFSEA